VDLARFHRAQAQPSSGYDTALAELRAGRKDSHWIWYVFPQLAGLGSSSQSRAFGLAGLDEAVEYLRDPMLGPHLIEATTVVADHIGAASAPVAPSLTLTGPRTAIELSFRGREAPWRSDRQNALVRSFLSAIRGAEEPPQPSFVLKTGTSDMNVVGPLWRCPIVAYGPGDSALDHAPHEHLSLDEYWRAIQVVERMLRAFAAS
jgi:hypothetical protein